MDIIQRLYDNQVHHAALLYDAPGLHPDDQAWQAEAQKTSCSENFSEIRDFL